MFGSTKFEDLRDLYVEEIKDVYDAEHRILDALPRMAEKANDDQLKQAFRSHLEETRGQVRRLEQVFGSLGIDPDRKTCEAMKGLMSEGDELLGAKGDGDVIDAALIGAAQRVEHYEMAAYGTLRTLARQLGHEDQARLLQETLDEEGAADEKLTRIAESRVNRKAVTA